MRRKFGTREADRRIQSVSSNPARPLKHGDEAARTTSPNRAARAARKIAQPGSGPAPSFAGFPMNHHIIIDAPSKHAVCRHCGASESLRLPCPVDEMAAAMLRFEAAHAACPKPAVPLVIKLPRPAPVTSTDALFAWPGLAAWLDEGDRGLSSEAIVQAITGIPLNDDPTAAPWDAHDFERCVALMERVPSFIANLGRVATLSPEWERLIAAWGDLAALRGDGHDARRRLTDQLRLVVAGTMVSHQSQT